MDVRTWKDTSGYLDNHQAEWSRGGKEFFSKLVALINSAERVIHFQVYIIIPDEAGRPVIDALKKAAKRGVHVHLVVDDFGSDKVDDKLEAELNEVGIQFKRFEPILSAWKFYVGRRMHHKVVVVDEKRAMVCGLNIADRYKGTKDEPPWLDYGVFVEGPVCTDLARACNRILERQFIPATPKWPQRRKGALDPGKVWVRLRKNDWLRNRRDITISYNRAVAMATKSITIVGGYFLPGRKFRRLLADAAKRSVDVKIIMTRDSDVPTVKYASDYLYGWLMRHKIRLYESNISMVHGKVAIVDETWSTIGSYNQNHLSAYLSIELNLDIVNYEFSKGFNAHLLDVIKNECTEVTKDSYYLQASVFAKLRRWISFQLVRTSLRVLFVINRIFRIND